MGLQQKFRLAQAINKSDPDALKKSKKVKSEFLSPGDENYQYGSIGSGVAQTGAVGRGYFYNGLIPYGASLKDLKDIVAYEKTKKEGKKTGGAYVTDALIHTNITLKDIENVVEAAKDKANRLARERRQKKKAKKGIEANGAGLRRRHIKKLIIVKNGNGVATALLQPLLTAGISALAPHIVKGVSSAISWLGKKITGKGKKLTNEQRLIIKGEGKKLKNLLKFIKSKGLPFIQKLAKVISQKEGLLNKLVENSDHGKLVTKIINIAAELAEPYVEKLAKSTDDDHTFLKESDKELPDFEEGEIKTASGIKKTIITSTIKKGKGRPLGVGNKKK